VKFYSGNTETYEKKGERRILFRLWHIVFIMMGVAIFLFRSCIQLSPQKIEYGYSRAIYPYIASIQSLPARWIPAPYSASEIFLTLIFVLVSVRLGYSVHIAVQKKELAGFFLKTSVDLCALTAGIYFSYLTVWGFNYLREPFAAALNQESPEHLQLADYEQLANDMIFLANKLCTSDPCPADGADDLRESDKAVDRSLGRVMDMARIPRIHSPPRTKFLFPGGFPDVLGISGFFSPLFMEPHVNSGLTAWEFPFVIAHEKAHLAGFASEADAGFIAYLTCLTSASDTLRYSAALNILLALRQYFPEEQWRELLRAKLSQTVKNDMNARGKRIRHNHEKYALFIRFSRKVNDTYLKLNSRKLGIRSYAAALPRFAVWWKKQRWMLF